MQKRTQQTNLKGVISHHGRSLCFSIVNGRLLLQTGAAISIRGEYLDLSRPSYIVCQDIDLSIFENQKRYYLYIDKNIKNKIGGGIVFASLEADIQLIITEDKNEDMIFLGELNVDYENNNNDNNQVLGVPRNCFTPQVNEIDIRQRETVVFKQNIMSTEEIEWFSMPIYTFAYTLQQTIKRKKLWEMSILVQSFFDFHESIASDNLNYAQLYSKCINYSKLFSWIDMSIFNNTVKKHTDMLMTTTSGEAHLYRCSPYQIDRDKQDGFFYCYRENILQITESLSQLDTLHESKFGRGVSISREPKTDSFSNFEDILHKSPAASTCNEQTIHQNHQDSIEDFLFSNSHEEAASTKEAGVIQIGRGRNCDNDIILDSSDSSISRIHAKISPHKHGFFIEDISKMGIYIDGVKMKKNTKEFVTEKTNIVLGMRGYKLDLTKL